MDYAGTCSSAVETLNWRRSEEDSMKTHHRFLEEAGEDVRSASLKVTREGSWRARALEEPEAAFSAAY